MKIDEILKELKKTTDPKRQEPLWKCTLSYDSTAEQLEPIYFWILDFMKDSMEVEKLVDNFSASVGGGYFSELGQKTTKMQEEAMKILGYVNQILKSIINLLYDLKDFEMRLKMYEDVKNEGKKEAALLALKQVWMDKVDIQRGRGSINALSYELNFATIRDAFMAVRNVEQRGIEEVGNMDLNDTVKRILKPRIAEFSDWIKRSEKELRTRYELEKNYLKSQVNSLKLYTSWVKPYLISAEQLRMKEADLKDPTLVNAFNTIVLELKLFGKSKIDVKKAADVEQALPKSMRDYKPKRDYYSCVVVELSFRGLPSRTPQGHFTFGGKTDVEFKAFTLNSEELEIFNKKVNEAEWAETLKLIQGTTDDSMKQIQEDIDHFIQEDKEEKKVEMTLLGPKEIKPKKEEKKPKKEVKKLELKDIKKDNHEESLMRNLVEIGAAETCFKIYNIYKKTHDMATPPGDPEWELYEWKRTFQPEWRK